MQAGGNTLCSEIHKLINSIWNKEELSQQWKESYIAAICTRADKTDCRSLLLTTYKMLSNILVSRLTPYIDRNYWASSVWIFS